MELCNKNRYIWKYRDPLSSKKQVNDMLVGISNIENIRLKRIQRHSYVPLKAFLISSRSLAVTKALIRLGFLLPRGIPSKCRLNVSFVLLPVKISPLVQCASSSPRRFIPIIGIARFLATFAKTQFRRPCCIAFLD